MNSDQEKEYLSLVRGVATYILLGQTNPAIDASELGRTFNLPLERVNADIDAIVASEHHKVGGVFELQDAS